MKRVDRIKGLRGFMEERGLKCALVFTADEHGSEYIDEHYKFRAYLSGFTGSAGTLLVTMDEAGLWTDGRYFLQAGNQLKDTGIKLHKTGEPGVKDIYEYLTVLAREGGEGYKIGVDLRLVSKASYDKLMKICRETGCIIEDTDAADAVWKNRPDLTLNPINILNMELAGRSSLDKIIGLREKLTKFGADALVISDLSDIMWTYNIRGNDIPYNPVAVTFGYVDKRKAFLYAYPESLSPSVRETLENEGVEIRDYNDFDKDMKELKGVKILYDALTLNAHIFTLIKENETVNRKSWEYIDKYIKNETECTLARKWHIEDGLAVTRFIFKIKNEVPKRFGEGSPVTEYEAAAMMDELRYEIPGNRGLSFDTISAYGENGAVVHYSPDREESAGLRPEGFLLVDSGGQYEGATTDITRTIALGPLTDEMKRDYTLVLKGMLDLADAVFPDGTRGENLDVLARRPLWERYMDYRHGTGHGVGAQLSVHEGPQAFRFRINRDAPQPGLKPGMLTSDEPGLYLEGEYGIRIENLLLCVDKERSEWGDFYGFETLTSVPYERDAIIPDMLTLKQKEIVNEYHARVYDLYKDRLTDEERIWLSKVTSPL